MRLRWSGNLDAQKQADDAYGGLRRKRKPPRRPHRRRKPQAYKNADFCYDKYLKGKWWRKRRLKAIADSQGKCSRCGGTENLHVHHLSYIRLYHEKKKDLLVLCEGCHKGEHATDNAAKEHLAAIIEEGPP